MAYTAELLARIQTLKDGPYKDLRAAARAVGITEKPADESWDDQAEAIALKEFELAGKPIHEGDEVASPGESAIAPTVEPQPTFVFPSRAGGVKTCSMCGEKLRTGMSGERICAIASNSCPILSSP